jgi:hypothetical protein
LSSPARLHALLDVVKQDVAVDAGFDLDDFVRNALAFPDRPVALYTLPVTDFGKISDGEDVNFIDTSAIRSIVHNLVAGDSPTATTTGTVSVTLEVVNASGRQGEAASLESSLATGRFSKGAVSSADTTSQTSSIDYGAGAQVAAAELGDEFGITANASSSVADNTVRLTVGTDFARFDKSNHTSTSTSPTTTTVTTPVSTVPATGTGTLEPAPTNLTRMTADGIPCVK